MVTTAEIMQTLKYVDANWSFRSANDKGKRYALMFPKSLVAKNFTLNETKLKYTIQFGIAPHFRDLLKADLKRTAYTFKFDETSKQIRIQCVKECRRVLSGGKKQGVTDSRQRDNSTTTPVEFEDSVFPPQQHDVFYDTKASLEEQEQYEIQETVTLEMLYVELRLYRSELLSKMCNVKEDLFIQVKNNNRELLKEIEILKKNLIEKDQIIESMKNDINNIKDEISDFVTHNEFVFVERDVIDLQQYVRRNNVEISGIPEEVSDIQGKAY